VGKSRRAVRCWRCECSETEWMDDSECSKAVRKFHAKAVSGVLVREVIRGSRRFYPRHSSMVE
jgi:hypothetical protein